MSDLQINGSRLLQLPLIESNSTFLSGFWQWVSLLAQGRYDLAVEALYWENQPIKPETLRQRIATFFGGPSEFTPVIPNDRLVRLVEDNAEIEWKQGEGWGLAQIPVTTTPDRCKDDDVPLMGLAVSFFVRRVQNSFVLEFEVFHA